MDQFDLIAIGGGTAGLVTVAGAAALGLRPALIEREALGGDCLWTGCVPSKALIASAKLAHQMRHAERWGLVGTAPAHVFKAVMDRMRAARGRVAEHDDPERFRRMGVEVVFGSAEVRGPNRVTVDGRRLTGKRLVVATGSSPTIPPISGLAESGYLTHLTAFDQDVLPPRIAILGGGPIGLEFAQIYRRLGAEVVVLEMLSGVLPREDPEASHAVAAVLRDEGIRIHTDTRIEGVAMGRDGAKVVRGVTAGGDAVVVTVDEIFVATGRRAHTAGLGLEAVGVEIDRGAVKVDRTLRSTVPSIWAAGDVAGGLQFTHVADYQAKLVLRNAVFPFASKADYSCVPWVTYTDPEVAHVGLTEEQARESHGSVSVYRYDLRDLDRAIVDGYPRGFVKITTRRNGKILGATVVGSNAGDLLMPIVLAKRQGMPVGKLSRVVYPYPTMVEGVKRAADSYYRSKLGGPAGSILRRVVQWLR